MPKPKKSRLDVLLVELGHFETRAKAQAAIMAGEITVDKKVCDKAGQAVAHNARIDVRARPRWVGRGADKLDAAFERFGLSCAGCMALDIGAGSGGFTQVLLARGAARVFAVDVGYGQFDVKLRADPRVTLIERKNARELSSKDVPEPVGFFVMDVSFISIFKVLPAICPLLRPRAHGIVLFKPNFEARREEVPKGGILLDPQIHRRLLDEAGVNLGNLMIPLVDLAPSPIRGGTGNVEYLFHVARDAESTIAAEKMAGVVDQAFNNT